MGTRAAIFFYNNDELQKHSGIYSHWDGYPSGLGKDLLDMLEKRYDFTPLRQHPSYSYAGYWDGKAESIQPFNHTYSPDYARQEGVIQYHTDSDNNDFVQFDTATNWGCEWVYCVHPQKGLINIYRVRYGAHPHFIATVTANYRVTTATVDYRGYDDGFWDDIENEG